MSESRAYGPTARLIALIGMVIGYANLFLYLLITAMSGGSAAGARIRDGHYYFVQHGHYTQVSPRAYWLSRIHGRSLVVTIPIALLCQMWLRSIREDDEQYSPLGRKTSN